MKLEEFDQLREYDNVRQIESLVSAGFNYAERAEITFVEKGFFTRGKMVTQQVYVLGVCHKPILSLFFYKTKDVNINKETERKSFSLIPLESIRDYRPLVPQDTKDR